MSVIWKYPIPYDVEFEHEMPVGAEILTAETQYQGIPNREQMVMWARVDPDAARETRRFCLAVTGGRGHAELGGYIGTCQLNGGSLIFHIFEAA